MITQVWHVLAVTNDYHDIRYAGPKLCVDCERELLALAVNAIGAGCGVGQFVTKGLHEGRHVVWQVVPTCTFLVPSDCRYMPDHQTWQ